MVEKEPTQEFTMSGLEATTLKAWRNSRDALALARLIARRTKIIIGVGCRRRHSLGYCRIHVVACARTSA